MKIIELRAENIKRLTAVQIRPDGRVVKISGKNDAGKSSVLDSIWMALGGAEAIPADPIHEGADEARIRLDLGDMVVVRKLRRVEGQPPFTTTLVIENADGSRARSPQTLLNELVGRYSLDPLEFSRLRPKDQFDALKILVPGIDLDEIEKANGADYERRTFNNRKAKELLAGAAAIMVAPGKWVKTDEAPILADLARAGEHNQHLQARANRREKAVADAEKLESQATAMRERIAALEEEVARLQTQLPDVIKQSEDLRRRLKTAPDLPEPLDTAHLAERLTEARNTNANAEKLAQKAELERQAAEHEKISEALTAAMESRDQQKNAAIAAAKLPVPGLTLGSGEVLIDGHPFAVASASQRLKISTALAMALHPQIRVLRIEDGSLLDKASMTVISEMAEANDFQVWMEVVDETGKVGVVIEDGKVRGA